MPMEQVLAPLKKKLITERLIEPDWDALVARLDEIHAELSKEAQVTVDDVIERVYGQKMGQPLIDELVKNEERRAKIKEVARTLNFDRTIIEFFKGNVFFTEVSRWIRKTRGTSWKGMPIPTAAMCYNVEYDDFEMIWNPEFFAAFLVDHGQSEGEKMIQFIYGHELYHFTLKHITVRRRTPAFGWNIATDAAINSLQTHAGMTMPPCGILPGRKWGSVPLRTELRYGKARRKLTPEEEKMMEGLSDLVESWPTMKSSEWYFASLGDWAKETGNKITDRGIQVPGGTSDSLEDMFSEMDIHDLWDKLPQEARERVTDRLRDVMKEAAIKADNEANGWGNMPADLQRDIRAFIDNRVDWEAIVKTYLGSFTRGDRVKSIKKINKKYAYVHAGHRRTYRPKLLILVDQSASVSDVHVTLMFAVLMALAKLIDFTIVPFDTSVAEHAKIEWRKGMPAPQLKRTKCGGTDFKAACDWANAPERRGNWDGMLVLTDGECYDPGPSRLKRAWLIVPGHKLMFPTKELVVQMEDSGSARRDGTIR